MPARFAASAIQEAADCRIPLIICITEGIPVLEMVEMYHYVKKKGVRLIGPNCPGLVSPGKSKVGIMPGFIHRAGSVGVISRSGTLTYEVVAGLTAAGLGQSTCVGIGGDPIIGTGFVELLELFEKDPQTSAIVLIGEIGGEDEEEAAVYIRDTHDQAGRGIYRRQNGAAGKTDGPRRGNRVRETRAAPEGKSRRCVQPASWWSTGRI